MSPDPAPEIDPETGDQARLVETGSFRVDRTKALEKLAAFRRRDVGCVMLFARCAAAAGAKSLAIDESGRAVELRFDGQPFERAELVDPYAALFADEGTWRPAMRWLALAMVHAWRPSLARLTVSSGPADKRWRMTATGMGEELVDEEKEAGAGTVVRLELSRSDEAHWRHPIPAESLACLPRSHLWGRLEVTVLRSGTVAAKAAPRPPGPGELVFDQDGVYGHLSIPSDGSPQSVVDAYVDGVYGGPVVWDDPRAPIVGKIDDPRLSLDASLAALVRNDAYDEVVKALRARAQELVVKTAREQGERLAETGKLLAGSPALRDLWRRRLTGPSVEREWRLGWEARLREFFSSARWHAQVERVLYDACATAWLRGLAAGAKGRNAELKDALEAVPLAFASGWRPVAASELRAGLRAKRLFLAREPGNMALAKDKELAVWYDGAPSEFWGYFELSAEKR